MRKQTQQRNTLPGNWVDENTAITWPTGVVVLIHRLDRPLNHCNALELNLWFRPDWVINHAIGFDMPMEFMRITEKRVE